MRSGKTSGKGKSGAWVATLDIETCLSEAVLLPFITLIVCKNSLIVDGFSCGTRSILFCGTKQQQY
jgi:hypothetical protein